MKNKFLLLVVSLHLMLNASASNDHALRLCAVKSLYNKGGAVADALDQGFLSKVKNLFAVDAFIETGTFLGESSARAAKIFKEIHTIEIDQNLFNLSKNDLSIYPNVICHLGDSAKVLSLVLQNLKLKSLFWLDGHYSGTCHAGFNTGLGDEITPIFAELKAIEDAGMKDAVILIDDIRCFDEMLPITNPGHMAVAGYPNILHVLPAIKQINPNYTFKIFGDTLFAFTDAIKTSRIIDACTVSRLYQDTTYTLKELFDAEAYIAKSQGSETRILEQLYSNSQAEAVYTQYGCNKHYVLWKALRSLQTNPSLAYDLFNYAYNIGFTHWRIKWYMAQALLKTNNPAKGQQARDLIHSCKSLSPEIHNFLMTIER